MSPSLCIIFGYIFFIYHSPSSKACCMLDSISNHIDKVISLHMLPDISAFGDSNAHHTRWIKRPVTYLAGIQTLKLSITQYLTQVVDFPTRFPSNPDGHASLLGLCFTSIPDSFRATQLCLVNNSDHAVVSVNISFRSISSQEPPTSIISLIAD